MTLLLLLLPCGAMAAEPRHALSAFLGGAAAENQAACARADAASTESTDVRPELREAVRRSMQGLRQAVCQCMPARMDGWRATLTPAELNSALTPSHFSERFQERVSDPCMAEMARAEYGEGCIERYQGRVKNSTAFCPCMAMYMAAMPDGEVRRMGLEADEWGVKYRQAQAKGQPAPAFPPLLQSYRKETETCKAR
jgi:hypothetical protein